MSVSTKGEGGGALRLLKEIKAGLLPGHVVKPLQGGHCSGANQPNVLYVDYGRTVVSLVALLD